MTTTPQPLTLPRHPDGDLSNIPFTAGKSLNEVNPKAVILHATSHKNEQRNYFISPAHNIDAIYQTYVAAGFRDFYCTPWSSTVEQWNSMRQNYPIRRVLGDDWRTTLNVQVSSTLPSPPAPSKQPPSSVPPPPPPQQQQQQASPSQQQGMPGVAAPPGVSADVQFMMASMLQQGQQQQAQITALASAIANRPVVAP